MKIHRRIVFLDRKFSIFFTSQFSLKIQLKMKKFPKIFEIEKKRIFSIFNRIFNENWDLKIFEKFRPQKFSSMDVLFDLKIFRINIFGRSFFWKSLFWRGQSISDRIAGNRALYLSISYGFNKISYFFSPCPQGSWADLRLVMWLMCSHFMNFKYFWFQFSSAITWAPTQDSRPEAQNPNSPAARSPPTIKSTKQVVLRRSI